MIMKNTLKGRTMICYCFSAASMYNTHETIAVETERQYDEKRQADDRKTKQKMELIRSKLKTHTRKVIYIIDYCEQKDSNFN